MTTTNQQTNENLRVLILPQADIQRLRWLLAEEINSNAVVIKSGEYNYSYYKKENKAQAKAQRNYNSLMRNKQKNLANLQYKLKHQTLYPIDAALMLSEALNTQFHSYD